MRSPSLCFEEDSKQSCYDLDTTYHNNYRQDQKSCLFFVVSRIIPKFAILEPKAIIKMKLK